MRNPDNIKFSTPKSEVKFVDGHILCPRGKPFSLSDFLEAQEDKRQLGKIDCRRQTGGVQQGSFRSTSRRDTHYED